MNQTFSATACDNVGNCNTQVTATVKIDNTPPTTPALATIAANWTSGAMNFNYTGSTDSLSGLATPYQTFVRNASAATVFTETENDGQANFLASLRCANFQQVLTFGIFIQDIAGNTSASATRTANASETGFNMLFPGCQ